MSSRSYAKTLDGLLKPFGFERRGSEWSRVRGDMWECVDLQTSSIAGVTANIMAKDIVTESILSSVPCSRPIFMHPISMRIGHLIDGYDRWWRNNPDGPAELAAAVAAAPGTDQKTPQN